MSAIAPRTTAVRRQPAQPRLDISRTLVDPLHRLDQTLASWLDVDLRLIYGMGVPVVCVVAAMVAMFLHPTYVLVGAVLALELLCLSLVVTKLLAMLNEPNDDDNLSVDPGSRGNA